MRTSALPSLLGERSWRKFRLHKGWAGIILCMMWEEARGDDSKWSVYLSENISIIIMSCLPTAYVFRKYANAVQYAHVLDSRGARGTWWNDSAW